MFSSVRGRITLIATALVAVALLLASIVVLRMVESDLIDATERALSAELELEAAIFDIDDETQFFEFESEGRELALGVFLEDDGFAFGSIFDPGNGIAVADVVIDTAQVEVLDVFNPLTGELVTDEGLIQAVEELNFEFLDVDGDEGNVLLVGAVARGEVDATLAAVRDALWVIVPIFTLLMGVLIWWLVGRALKPVKAMSARVQEISSSSLDQRVPVPGGGDEISGLATVMNGMLSRLQRGDIRQRQFAADASHELRSPLSTVRAAAEMIERNPSSERAPGLAADIVAEADRMDSLIGDLLNLSRIDEETAAHGHVLVDLSELVSGFAVDHHRVEPGVMVRGDHAQLERAVGNLVQNARRHAVEVVSLSLRSVTHNGIVFAECCVEDDGAGVPLEQRSAIFERFSRLDEARARNQGGVGLGLALVQAIAARHRGSVAVDDSPELGGARFTIHLPL